MGISCVGGTTSSWKKGGTQAVFCLRPTFSLAYLGDDPVLHGHLCKEFAADPGDVGTIGNREDSVVTVLGAEHGGLLVAEALADVFLENLLGGVDCDHGHCVAPRCLDDNCGIADWVVVSTTYLIDTTFLLPPAEGIILGGEEGLATLIQGLGLDQGDVQFIAEELDHEDRAVAVADQVIEESLGGLAQVVVPAAEEEVIDGGVDRVHLVSPVCLDDNCGIAGWAVVSTINFQWRKKPHSR